MFIAKNNALRSVRPTISTGLSGDLPSNITSPDFSLNYNSSSTRLGMRFGTVDPCSYVSICVTNYGNGTVTLRNGQQTLGIYTNTGRDHVLMFVFPEQRVFSLDIVIQSSTSSQKPIVSFVAAGQTIEVPNGGEVSGYMRNWLTRNIESRTQKNAFSAPVANLVKRTPLKGRLNIPNARAEFTRGEWMEFLDHAALEPFFITESILPILEEGVEPPVPTPQASYLCYNPKFQAPKAHSQTRALENLGIMFECYNGL